MANNDSPRKPLPPYLSFKTLLSFMDKLKEAVVPERIDTSVLQNYAGSTAAQLTAALRFLSLIEDNGNTTTLLEEIVNAYRTDNWAGQFAVVMKKAYTPIVGDLKLETATPGMLNQRFREWGAEGEVLEKCVRFYEAGMIEGGAKLSPHILNKPRAKPDRKIKPKPKQGRPENVEDETEDLLPQGKDTKRFVFPVPEKPDAVLVLPVDLASEDWDMIDSMIRAYVRRKEGK